jgi:hypothetical protein
MEVFVMGYERKTKMPFTFIVTSTYFDQYKNTATKLLKKYKSLELTASDYRAAGADQIRLEFRDLNEFEDILINEKKIVMSIKEMNLRLMRKGGTIFSPFHCFDLVHDVLDS